MNTKISIFIFFMICWNISFPQCKQSINEIFIDFGLNDYGNSVAINNKSVFATSIQNSKLLVSKFDYNGKLLLSKRLNTSFNVLEETDISILSNNSIMLTGRCSLNGDDIFVCKIDSSLNVIWYKTFGGFLPDIARDVLFLNEKNILIVGTTNSFSIAGSDLYVLKLDTNGLVIWNKVFGTVSQEHGVEVNEDNVGNLYIVSPTDIGGDPNGLLYKIDKSGNLLWSKLHSTLSSDDYRSMILSSNNSLISSGRTTYQSFGQNDFLLTSSDLSGNIIWSKKYGTFNDEHSGKVIETFDKGFLMCGYTGNISNRDILLIKISQNGNVEWSKKIGGNKDDYINKWSASVCQTPDSGFVVVGSSNSFSANGDYDVYVIKLNKCGESGCNSQDYVIQSGNVPLSVSAISMTESSGGTLTSPSVSSSNVTYIDSTLCYVPPPPCVVNANFSVSNKCFGSKVMLKPTNQDASTTYYWYSNGTLLDSIPQVEFLPNDTITYQIVLKAAKDSNCFASDTHNFAIFPYPKAVASPNDTTVLVGSEVNLKGCCGSFYKWRPDSLFKNYQLKNQEITVNSPLELVMETHNGNNCVVFDTINIKTKTLDLYIPNVISPNNDGINDAFSITALPEFSTLKIFNRWGKMVYESSNYKNNWQGENCIDGVYLYELEIVKLKSVYKGWIQILR